MTREVVAKVVTGNDLRLGDVVYRAANGAWVRALSAAELIEDVAIADLKLLEAMAQQGDVVGVYLADARRGPAGPEPVHFREAFRARGPSNYRHGKQETRHV
ncbi:DUF2849 domain-containing protein [Phaeovulum sp.]|jgi:hypothetical protein|uniref:DUF2849 domain-containing protein n=1 Tax=Phaeovulum sp. TaxID=2934796 RepID=UPI00272F6FA9|nr:DUF2849 domain-containing protein [Phaeovulum sp.]MDP1667692.1 DUF2849 domain-containing protein [Phaeovulum sp.]MDP2062476.1 DUF2849 domain-containing protein [Phaeovulum sp.]MDP3861910.1 DUF2849 domain-containing protein [Phaeovulum sp.]MDZ4118417.1 DUF2849 domain-containing protein [Phaeovulum sp.]